jgi:hypothetical protein
MMGMCSAFEPTFSSRATPSLHFSLALHKPPVDLRAALATVRGENDILRDANRLLSEANRILEQQHTGLVNRIGTLEARILDLEGRLRANSQKSSKPLSSDGHAKPALKSRRQRSGRKPGKQPGSAGQHLAQVAGPEVVVTHSPERCTGCGSDLSGAPVTGAVRRQVFDLPPTALVSTPSSTVTLRGRHTTANSG